MGNGDLSGECQVKNKGLFLIIGMIVLIITITGAGCMEKTYGYSNNGAAVHVKPGNTIRVSLGQTPSTGYVWNATITGDLEITRKDFGSLGALSGMPGADTGTITWYLTAGQAAVQKFSAIKMRPGNATRIIDQFEITFLVDNGTPRPHVT